MVEETSPLYPIQFAGIKLLEEVDRICKKYKIQYFVWGGTMLGAVRHRDLIPWDDDVDIVLKRPEFDRLLKALRKELSCEYELAIPGENGYFYAPMCKLIYKNSILSPSTAETRYYKEHYNRVSLDIFVLDNAMSGIMLNAQLFGLKAVYGMAMAYRYKVNILEYNGIEKIAVTFLSKLGKMIPVKNLMSWYTVISKCASDRSKEFLISNDSILVMHQHYKKRWFKKAVYLPIGDKKYPVPACYDEIMKYIYGDYMQLPPEEKRKPVHTSDYGSVKVYYNNRQVVSH